jgi:hypothetical protein
MKKNAPSNIFLIAYCRNLFSDRQGGLDRVSLPAATPA